MMIHMVYLGDHLSSTYLVILRVHIMGHIMVPTTVHDLPCDVQQVSTDVYTPMLSIVLLSTATLYLSDITHMVYGMLVHTDTVDMVLNTMNIHAVLGRTCMFNLARVYSWCSM